MKTLFRILGTAAAVAVTGAAIVALDKILNQKDPLHVEEVEFPEDAEQNAEEAARRHPRRAARSRCSTRKLPTRTLWKQAPLLLPKTRAENSTPPRSPKPVTLATGKNRAAKDNL